MATILTLKLPVLPAGHFWDVQTKSYNGEPLLYLHLVKKEKEESRTISRSLMGKVSEFTTPNSSDYLEELIDTAWVNSCYSYCNNFEDWDPKTDADFASIQASFFVFILE